jgi:hypothetical protein
VTDGHLLSFVPFTFNFDDSYITLSAGALPPITFSPVALPCNGHLKLQTGQVLAIKKPAKKSFRVLAGMGYKPKRLLATFLFKLL